MNEFELEVSDVWSLGDLRVGVVQDPAVPEVPKVYNGWKYSQIQCKALEVEEQSHRAVILWCPTLLNFPLGYDGNK